MFAYNLILGSIETTISGQWVPAVWKLDTDRRLLKSDISMHNLIHHQWYQCKQVLANPLNTEKCVLTNTTVCLIEIGPKSTLRKCSWWFMCTLVIRSIYVAVWVMYMDKWRHRLVVVNTLQIEDVRLLR